MTTTIGFVPEVMVYKLSFGGIRQKVSKYNIFHHFLLKTECTSDQIDVM